MSENKQEFHLHLYIHEDANKSDQKFNTILDLLKKIQKGEQDIMADLTALTTQVTANTDAEASAIQLITNIAAALKAAGTDPVAIAALQSQLETSRAALAAAVVANTPAA